MLDDRITVQIGTYNANLQGHGGLPQNLVDWLVPSLHVSQFLARSRTASDIVAIGFQELLPLQLGFAGMSEAVMRSRDELIRSQLEFHAPQKERYILVAKVVNVGIALLVYARDDTVARRISKVQTQWTGCGPGWMGNKGAVGVRFDVSPSNGSGAGETYTFVNAHLTAHQQLLDQRVKDYKHIVETLLFHGRNPSELENIYHSTHLFFFGDLNFRLEPPKSISREGFEQRIRSDEGRESLVQYDQLCRVRNEGKALFSLREGDFWRFPCTYKYVHGEVDKYNAKRMPSWTDRILFASAEDDPNDLSTSAITSLAYTSVLSYVTSDHKPVMAILQMPNTRASASLQSSSIPSPPQFSNDPYWVWKRYTGKVLGWIVGWTWSLFWFVGAGNTIAGVVGGLLGMVGIVWWNNPNADST